MRAGSRNSHRGLAMLELVLALPLLLFIMALMIDFAAVATWKIRGESVARLAVWETRWPRTGSSDPRPSYWPATASSASSDQGSVAAMDDPRVDVPVARGPLQGTSVNPDLLDPTRGLREGSASYAVTYPLLSKMGSRTVTAQTWLIDDKWQYLTPEMGMWSNWLRRIPVLYYPLAKAPASLVSAYTQAVLAIDEAPFRPQLAPLDNDPDFKFYWGWAPDFQPQFQQMCSTDRALTDKSVQQLINHIQGKHSKRQHIPSVAEVMAGAFLGLYQQALNADQAIVHQKNPPASPQAVALAQSQIPQLQTNVSELQSFLQSMQQ